MFNIDRFLREELANKSEAVQAKAKVAFSVMDNGDYKEGSRLFLECYELDPSNTLFIYLNSLDKAKWENRTAYMDKAIQEYQLFTTPEKDYLLAFILDMFQKRSFQICRATGGDWKDYDGFLYLYFARVISEAKLSENYGKYPETSKVITQTIGKVSKGYIISAVKTQKIYFKKGDYEIINFLDFEEAIDVYSTIAEFLDIQKGVTAKKKAIARQGRAGTLGPLQWVGIVFAFLAYLFLIIWWSTPVDFFVVSDGSGNRLFDLMGNELFPELIVIAILIFSMHLASAITLIVDISLIKSSIKSKKLFTILSVAAILCELVSLICVNILKIKRLSGWLPQQTQMTCFISMPVIMVCLIPLLVFSIKNDILGKNKE